MLISSELFIIIFLIFDIGLLPMNSEKEKLLNLQSFNKLSISETLDRLMKFPPIWKPSEPQSWQI